MGCSQQLIEHLKECFKNGMTKDEVDKKYYWLKDIISDVYKAIAKSECVKPKQSGSNNA